jgi:ABC-2 type transport system permease protein
MSALIVNEFTKLRTVRGPWLLLVIQQVVIVAGISGLAAAGADLATGDGMASLLSHAGIASAIFTLVLGITAVAGEYRHKSITDTYLATPRRGRVLLAKLVAYAGVGAVIGVISAATGLAVTAAWLSTKDSAVDLSDPLVWRIVAGIVAFNALYAGIGVSLGGLVRNQTGAIAMALVWIALVETTAANLIGDLGRWLPNRAGMGLDAMPAAVPLLPQWGAALVLAAYAAGFAVVAAATTVRRDVT